MPLDNWQIEAIPFAAAKAGEWLDTVGKTDLAQMTPDEWLCFIEAVCIAYETKMDEQRMSEEPPF